MLQPFKKSSYRRKVRPLQASHLENPFLEMDIYLERKMRDYTKKHFKKIWCIEHAVRELKANMDRLEDTGRLEQLDLHTTNEENLYQAISIKRQKYDESLTEAGGSCYNSPNRNSPPPVLAGEYTPKAQHFTTCSLSSDEFHEVPHLDNSEASIYIEPLTAPVDSQHILNSLEAMVSPASDYYKEDHLNVTPPKAELVVLGPHGTTVSAEFMMSLDWSTGSQVTRKLLAHIFDRETLATHTLTGKPSPAFKDRNMPERKALDPLIVADIVHAVTLYGNCTTRDVRLAITTKCFDEKKLLRNRTKANKENMSHGVGKTGKSYANK